MKGSPERRSERRSPGRGVKITSSVQAAWVGSRGPAEVVSLRAGEYVDGRDDGRRKLMADDGRSAALRELIQQKRRLDRMAYGEGESYGEADASFVGGHVMYSHWE